MAKKAVVGDRSRAEVIGPNEAKPFGDFMKERRVASGIPVASLARQAGISRQNYYLLEANKQRPKLETAILVLRALGLEPSVPDSGEGDLEFDVDGQVHRLSIEWSSEREKSKALATGAGLAGLFGAGTGSAPLAAGAAVGVPVAGPALAVYFLRKYQAAGRVSDSWDGHLSKYELLAEFMREAEDAKPEHLEVMLYTLKAMRAEEPES